MAEDPKTCRCPLRPYYALGSWGSGSTLEDANLRLWEENHGTHLYAKTRDELARAIQAAEKDMGPGSGAAVLDMVHDIFELPRSKSK